MIKVNNKIDVIAVDGDTGVGTSVPDAEMTIGSCNVDDLMDGIFVDLCFSQSGEASTAVYTVKAEDLIAAVQNATRLGAWP